MKEWGSFDPRGIRASIQKKKRLPLILRKEAFDLEIVGVFDPGGMSVLRPRRR